MSGEDILSIRTRVANLIKEKVKEFIKTNTEIIATAPINGELTMALICVLIELSMEATTDKTKCEISSTRCIV